MYLHVISVCACVYMKTTGKYNVVIQILNYYLTYLVYPLPENVELGSSWASFITVC